MKRPVIHPLPLPWLRRRWRIAAMVLLAIALLCGPAADWLQVQNRQADPEQHWDAVYLVCGARAQQRRILALTQWMERAAQPPPVILIGNDSQKSLWSRTHQRNLTSTEWGIAALQQWRTRRSGQDTVIPEIRAVPGVFTNTDGEMQALSAALRDGPDLQRIAMVTCRFHARRALQRLETHAPAGRTFAVVPGLPRLENRLPWVVAIEYAKLLRDALGYAQIPLLSRPPDSRPDSGRKDTDPLRFPSATNDSMLPP